MNKLKAVLLGLALFLPIFLYGCDPVHAAAASAVKVTSVKVEEWKNPKDGETYLVALPTWKNDGEVAVRQVMFVAGLKGGQEGSFTTEQPKEPQFYGAIVEPGTTITPQRVPEDGVILGNKKDLEEKYGKIDSDRVEVEGIGSPDEFVPEHKSNA
ncbi:MAG: hypothetical protein BGO01_15675 [Armatimonadetes bacterium 55-13]|nr:hypothetical protein [Armatimonadota bacterium]OJU65301.1 MAG: hypothetical protein BGO01_15675 [Armatimonadetes bacterium 55-13]